MLRDMLLLMLRPRLGFDFDARSFTPLAGDLDLDEYDREDE